MMHISNVTEAMYHSAGKRYCNHCGWLALPINVLVLSPLRVTCAICVCIDSVKLLATWLMLVSCHVMIVSPLRVTSIIVFASICYLCIDVKSITGDLGCPVCLWMT